PRQADVGEEPGREQRLERTVDQLFVPRITGLDLKIGANRLSLDPLSPDDTDVADGSGADRTGRWRPGPGRCRAAFGRGWRRQHRRRRGGLGNRRRRWPLARSLRRRNPRLSDDPQKNRDRGEERETQSMAMQNAPTPARSPPSAQAIASGHQA